MIILRWCGLEVMKTNEMIRPVSKTEANAATDSNKQDAKDKHRSQSFFNQDQTAPPLKKEDVDQVIEGLNEVFHITDTHLNFTRHEGTEEYYVKIINNETDEVIKEIPPKKLLDMVAKMEEYIGIMFDERV